MTLGCDYLLYSNHLLLVPAPLRIPPLSYVAENCEWCGARKSCERNELSRSAINQRLNDRINSSSE